MQLPAEIGFTSADTRRPKVILALCIVCCALCLLAALRFSWWCLLGLPLGVLPALVAIRTLRALRGRLVVREHEIEYHHGARNLLFKLSDCRVYGDRMACAGVRFVLGDSREAILLPRNGELIRFLRQRGLFENDVEVEAGDEAAEEITTPRRLLREFEETGRAEVALVPRGVAATVAAALIALGVSVGVGYVFARFVGTDAWWGQALAVWLAGTLTWWVHKHWPRPRLVFDQDAVTWQALFDSKWIAYENVTAVRFRKGRLSGRRLCIESPQRSIFVLENDPSLPAVLALLKRCCPSVAHPQAMDKNGEPQAPPMTGEYVVPIARTEAIVLFSAAILIALGAGAFLVFRWHRIEPIGVAILLGIPATLLIVCGAYWLLRLRAYVFTDTALVRSRIIGTAAVSLQELCQVRLDFEYDDSTPTECQNGHHRIELVFPDKVLAIDGRHTAVSVIELHEYIRQRYLDPSAPCPS